MAEFDGDTYEPEIDHDRLSTQLQAVKMLMADGEWRTLDEINLVVPGSVAGISARLRDLRKDKFGGYIVERRRSHIAIAGLFEYRLAVNR